MSAAHLVEVGEEELATDEALGHVLVGLDRIVDRQLD